MVAGGGGFGFGAREKWLGGYEADSVACARHQFLTVQVLISRIHVMRAARDPTACCGGGEGGSTPSGCCSGAAGDQLPPPLCCAGGV